MHDPLAFHAWAEFGFGPCEHEYTPNQDGTFEWCQKCDSIRPIPSRKDVP